MKTLFAQNHCGIFERIVRALDGRLFYVRFIVVERDGVLRGKVISCEAIRGLHADKMRTSRGFNPPYQGRCPSPRGRRVYQSFLLPAGKKEGGLLVSIKRRNEIIESPYFNKFDFLTVIKIRAPAYAADGRGLDAD